MKSKKGFTLIELLVVVLIIGILAAVALPQYQKAVDKSRATQAVQLISTLKQAAEVWQLAHPGERSDCFFYRDCQTYLDIDLPCKMRDDGSCQIGQDEPHVEIYSDGAATVYVYHYYTDNIFTYTTIAALRDTDGTWTYKCGYREGDNRGKAICDGLQGYESIEGYDI